MSASPHLIDENSFDRLDTRFSTYHELMAAKVLEILLVANPYDAYILADRSCQRTYRITCARGTG